MLWVHARLLEICSPREQKQLTISAHLSSWGVGPSVVPEVHDELLGLADIQYKVGVLIQALCFVVIAYQATNCGVICKLDPCVKRVQLYGAPVLRTTVDEVLLPIITT